MTEPVFGPPTSGEADEPRPGLPQVPTGDATTPTATARASGRAERDAGVDAGADSGVDAGLSQPSESATSAAAAAGEPGSIAAAAAGEPGPIAGGNGAPRKRRRRGSRGGRNRTRPTGAEGAESGADDDGDDDAELDRPTAADTDDVAGEAVGDDSGDPGEAGGEGGDRRPTIRSLGSSPGAVRRAPDGGPEPTPGPPVASGPSLVPAPPRPAPKIGDTRPARPQQTPTGRPGPGERGRPSAGESSAGGDAAPRKRRRRGGRGRGAADRGDLRPIEMSTAEPQEIDAETLERRRGRERKGRPVGRYLMCVHKTPEATQIAILEGRVLIEHYVSRPQDDTNQIDGNIYLGRVQNVLPGMEAAFIDIGTPKNAVLYRGDVRFDTEDVEGGRPSSTTRIEDLLKPGQLIVCQVTKNPIAHKGARLTQEVSLPGRFVVFIPDSTTYGISKRLADDERKRLRRILDDVKPANHGLIVRTAAEGATADELRRDVQRLAEQWERIDALAKRTRTPGLVYQEPDIAVRAIREEFNREYRGVVIDDRALYEDVRDYVASISPELADRVEFFDTAVEPLPLLERHHIHEQLHKAIDRKVWLPSGGSLIIERTEALNVIDVNTGKNVGTSNLEETVYRNNLEAAEEIARQLRLRDIGGIIVIDFIDMEIAANRNEVVRAFREALARDKTRTQVFDISELGLVEMTRKRVSEGLVESLSETCPTCGGRGIVFDDSLL